MPATFDQLTTTWRAVRAAKGRLDKRAAMIALFEQLDADDLRRAVRWLAGDTQSLGVAWATYADALAHAAPQGAPAPLTLAEVEALFAALAAAGGPGVATQRRLLLVDALARMDEPQRELLGALFTGELRAGAQRSLVVDAAARACGAKTKDVERAAMVAPLDDVMVALKTGASLAQFLLAPLVPVRPMLASTAGDLDADLQALGGVAAAEWKLDGVRVQVHKKGDEVKIFTRALRDVTDTTPWLVELARALPARDVILDGEAIAFYDDGGVLPFQELMSKFTTAGEGPFLVAFFDALYVDAPLVALPERERWEKLAALVDERFLVRRRVVRTALEVRAAMDEALAHGHEGLVLKSLDAPYDAGRRGALWKKLKPVQTVDLVILAAEWGHGRRTGLLSNLHLGARDPHDETKFWMLGKTFKGLTDAMLRDLTEQLPPLATSGPTTPRSGAVMTVRPEVVVEIAFDELLKSRRYDSGMALRFARVKRFRPDKSARDATTIDEMRALYTGPADAAGEADDDG